MARNFMRASASMMQPRAAVSTCGSSGGDKSCDALRTSNGSAVQCSAVQCSAVQCSAVRSLHCEWLYGLATLATLADIVATSMFDPLGTAANRTNGID
jgi:hypothetical protein